MNARTYLAAASLSGLVAVLLSLSSCRAVSAALDPGADPAETSKIERRLDQVETVAQTTATATAGVPGFGAVSGIAALIAAAVAAVHGAWRNQTRKTDPAVANVAKVA